MFGECLLGHDTITKYIFEAKLTDCTSEKHVSLVSLVVKGWEPIFRRLEIF